MNVSAKISVAAAALLVCGCGGGGGGGMPTVQPPTTLPPSPPPPPPPPTADSFRTAEYKRMGGALDQVQAADAYALGYTGQGVIIGLVDFNFDFGSSEVNYHPASVGPNSLAVALYEAQIGGQAESDPHGHAVAAVAAAKKNDTGIHGLAFNAQVLAVDYFSDVNETIVVQDGIEYHVSDPWTYLTTNGAHIVNTSFGYEASDVIPNPPKVTEAYVTESPAMVVANGALLVQAAGNAGNANPSLFVQDTIDILQANNLLNGGPGALIIAGAVDANNQIASFSNRAGTARNHYMVAPGVGLTVPWIGGLATVSGTSVSAPLVSAAAAIILERWPNLTARQVADILFQSATDLGAAGVDSVYGHGLLNVYAALQPMGTTMVATAGGSQSGVIATAAVLAPAFGDAPQFRAALSDVMILDGFGRDFRSDFSHAAVALPTLPDLVSVVEQKYLWQFAGYRVGRNTQFFYNVRLSREDAIAPFRQLNGAEDTQSHDAMFQFSGEVAGTTWSAGTGLSLRDALSPRKAEDPFTVASLTQGFSPMVGAARGAFATVRLELDEESGLTLGVAEEQVRGIRTGSMLQPDSWTHAVALKLDHDVGRSKFDLESGGMIEEGGVFGSLATGGLGMGERTTTVWTSATAETELTDRWTLKGSFTLAAAGAQHPSASLISSLGPVYATSVSFGLGGKDVFKDGDALAFVVGQPLRAESAPVTLTSGVGRDWTTGAVLMASTDSSLTPSGRELDLETAYRFSFEDWTVETSLAYSFDANHVRGENAVTTLLWLSRRF